MGTTVKSIIALGCVAAFFAFSNTQAEAKPAYAKKENKNCNYCHSVASGGGPRGYRGLYYGAHKLSFKAFDNKKEAKKAGVKPDAVGVATKPTKPYTGK